MNHFRVKILFCIILQLTVRAGISNGQSPGAIAAGIKVWLRSDNGISSSGATVGCQSGINGAVVLSIDSIPGATSYVWTVPSGCIITAGQGTRNILMSWTNISIQAGISGQACVYGASGCVTGASACRTIDLQVAAPVTPPSISGAGKLCPGDVITYSIAPVARASSYSWTPPAGMSITSGSGTNIVSAQVNAGYTGGTMSVSASNACGTSPLRLKTLQLNLPGTPTTITGLKNGLCNTTGSSYFVPSVVNANTYSWTLSNGSISSGQGTSTIAADFNIFSTSVITVRSVNSFGMSAARTITVTGNPAQAAAISYS